MKLRYSSATINRTRKLHHNTINEESDEKDHSLRKPLVTTKFVQWSSRRFAQPVMINKNKLQDVESSAYYEREWRHIRYVLLIMFDSRQYQEFWMPTSRAGTLKVALWEFCAFTARNDTFL